MAACVERLGQFVLQLDKIYDKMSMCEEFSVTEHNLLLPYQ